MTDSLLSHVLLSFLVGGIAVGSTTFAARKYSSGVGGLIGGLPSISSVSFFFIGLNQSPLAASQATIAFPLGMSFTFIFLIIYASLSQYGFKTAITTSLAAWFSLASLEAYIHIRDLLVSATAVTVVFITAQLLFRKRMNLRYSEGVGTGVSRKKLAEYSLLGGIVVATTVFFSQVLGTTAGGLFAAIPAIFSLTLTFTYLSDGGMSLSRSMAKPLMITAMTVAFPYSILVGLFYPVAGIYLGTLSAATAALPLAGLAYFLVQKKRI